MNRLLCSLVAAFIPGTLPAPDAAGAIRFPDDGGVLDVREFGGVPDDAVDDTASIQRALDAHPNGNRIVHLSEGTWIVSDTLRWPKGEGGNGEKRTILQGAGMARTRLLLPDATAGFSGPDPKALVWTGTAPAQRFRNALRDLTIEVGPGNPMAIALQFNASNQGTLRRIALRAAPGSGYIGLDLGHCDEIGPLLARHILVEGFETGISTKWPVNSNTFEHVILRGQRKLGWHNYHQMVFVRGLRSENTVTAIYNEKDSWGTVTLLDSQLAGKGTGAKVPGILNERQLYLRKVDVSGYGLAVDNADKGRDKGDVIDSGLVREDTSHANVVSLFRTVADGRFATAGGAGHLPVKETPEVPWGDPGRDWVNLVDFGADPAGEADSSKALQNAIDSGAKTVYLPAGLLFRFESTVEIRGPVERIIGLEGRFVAGSEAGGKEPVWRLVDGRHPRGLPDAPVVVIERMNNQSGGAEIRLLHESARTLVVSSAIGFSVEGRGTGDLFLDDLCGHLDHLGPGQSAWCRQLNSEREGTKCRNAGGKLWILGLKTEKTGTLIETTAGGITEVNGVFLYSNSGWRAGEPAFLVEDARLELYGVNERNFNQQPVSLWVRERQGGETRELAERPWVFLGGPANFPISR
jgi:hypothetical protein